MRWFLVFLFLLIATPALTPTVSAGAASQYMNQKIEREQEFQRRQARKLEALIKSLRQQFKRREIPEGVRIQKQRRYRQYRK